MLSMKRLLLISGLILILNFSNGMSSALAQHATAFDIEDGGQAFQNYCANCHGPDGDLIVGIDLGRGLFRRPLSDDDLSNIILKGIPDTPMPPTPGMGEEQALKIVAYLRSLADTQSGLIAGGDPERGKILFEGPGACMECHRVKGQGSRLGPDLSRIGLLRRAAELEQSLLDPAAEVQATNRFYSVTTMSGELITGRLMNHDTFTVQLLDSDEQLRSFLKSDLQVFGFSDPQMPVLPATFATQEVADLVEYLVSLRG